MKRSFVQCAELRLETDADPAAPGGAVTRALCGSWNHEGTCRWPHWTAAQWDDGRGMVRVVFVAEADEEGQVRALIERALTGGECVGPDRKVSRWKAMGHGAGALSESEEDWGKKHC